MRRIEYIPETAVLGSTPSTPASGYGKIYPKTNGKLAYLDSSGTEFDIFIGRSIVLAANFTNATNTRNIVTGWTFPVIAGRNYRVEIMGSFQTTAGGTGVTMSVNLSGGGVGTIIGNMEGDISQAAVATTLRRPIFAIGANGLAGSSLTTSGVNPTNSPHSLNANLYFRCSANGTFEVRFASENNGTTAQLNSGSVLTYRLI